MAANIIIADIVFDQDLQGGVISVAPSELTLDDVYSITSLNPNCNQSVFIHAISKQGSDFIFDFVDVQGELATWDNNSCPAINLKSAELTEVKFGCTDEEATNYDSQASNDDGSCVFRIDGCTDESATNYNPAATDDDGSCTYTDAQEVDETEYIGVTDVENLSSVYNDSGAVDTLTGALTEEDCTGVWIDGVGCTGGIKPLMAYGFDNVNSKLNAYFELVEEIQYKLDDTHEKLKEAKSLCKGEIDGSTVTDDSGNDIDCNTVAGLALYVTELENQLDTMTTDEDALTSLLTIINGTTGIESTFIDAESVGTTIVSLQTQIDTLTNENSGLNTQITDLELEITELESAVDAVTLSLSDLGYADIAEMATAIAALESQLEAALANQEDGITQADVDAAYADGAASVTPEDGISQVDVDAAYADGVASVTPEDGISQVDVDAAYDDGVASVVQDFTQADLDNAYNDGAASIAQDFTQADLDNAYNDGAASIAQDFTQADLDNAYNDGAASVTPEDGITQADVDAANVASDLLITDLQAQLDELTYNMGVMLNAIKGVISPTVGASLAEALGELITAYSTLSNANTTLSEANTALLDAVAAIDVATVTALADGDDGYNVHLVELIADIVSLNTELSDANTALATADSTAGSNSQDIANLNATIAALNANIGVLEADIDSYQSELSSINSELDGVYSDLSEFDVLSSTLGTQLDELSNYLAKYGYSSTDFGVDETSNMFYTPDDDNLVSVENDNLLTDVQGASWDGEASLGYDPSASFGEFAGGRKWSNFCAANGQPNSVKPLIDWGLEMRNFYRDNVNTSLKTRNMKPIKLNASGVLADCGGVPNFNVVNTGVNMTVFMPMETANQLNDHMLYMDTVFYAVNQRGDVVGSGKAITKAQSIAVFGKDAYTTQGKPKPLEEFHLVDGKEDAFYSESSHGVAEGEIISFRVKKREGVFAIVDSGGVVKTKYVTNSVFVLDGTYKLAPVCSIDYLEGQGDGVVTENTFTKKEGYPTWIKAAALIGGVYLLSKVFGKK